MDLSIIIVNWRSARDLETCLRSLASQAIPFSHEIWVIDNASYDGSDRMLAEKFPHVRFIQSDRNLGFAAANNRVAREAAGDCLLFLNPDTELRDQALRRLCLALQTNPEAGVAGPRLLNTDGSLQASCVQALPTLWNSLLDAEVLRRRFPRSSLWGNRVLFEPVAAPAPVGMVSGACLLTRRDLFQRLGGFSEEFFMYYEDADYCRRVRDAGSQVFYVPQAVVVHHGGNSSRQQVSRFAAVTMVESCAKYLRQHSGATTVIFFRLGLILCSSLRLLALAGLAAARFLTGQGPGSLASGAKWRFVLEWSLWPKSQTPKSP